MSLTPRHRAILRLAILPVLIIVALVVAWRLGYMQLNRREHFVELLRRADGAPSAAPLFVAACAAAIVLGLPTTVLSILGGALFGTVNGFLLAWSAALIGTTATHTLARSVGRKPLQKLLGQHVLLRKLQERADVWALMRLRVLPLAPFGVLNYLAGLAGVPLGSMLLATAIAIVPGTAAYSYAGQEFRVGLEDPGTGGHRALVLAGTVTVVMTALAFLPWLVEKVRGTRARSAGGDA